ncbi:acyl carrier protein [Candidatus Ozemobacteraceae bacterium]|nr:acyl carrier protein [Candidatus Ozemobacteraceae bacterium]
MSLEEKVVSIISRNIEKKKKDAVSLSSDLVSDLGADSLAVIMIIQALEDEFGISIDDEDFKKIKTVRDIVENLKTRYPALLEMK